MQGIRSLTGIVRTVWSHPLLLVVLAHTVFCFGIWNARDGYGEETANVMQAFRVLQSHRPDSSVYVNLYALILRSLTPDPVLAATLVKYVSSLLATAALCVALLRFSAVLRRGAIVCACLVWTASSLNAPFAQSSSLSLFTFALMLFGFSFLLRAPSAAALLGFAVLGLLAASLRPEYWLPVAVVGVVCAGRAVWRAARTIETRWGVSRTLVCVAAFLAAAAVGATLVRHPPPALARKVGRIDAYALFSLGQCYADYYRREHPQEIFSPMTEYRAVLDRVFDRPAHFSDAVENNPGEALRYFASNARHNLMRSIPNALVGRYREQSGQPGAYRPNWALRISLALGLLGAWRCFRSARLRLLAVPDLARHLTAPDSPVRNILLLLVLALASSVAILMLVGTPRYYLPLAPLFYLGIAYGIDSLLEVFRLGRLEGPLVALACVCLCRPNFLAPRPNEELDAVRHVAAYVREWPRVAAWWADPDVVLGLVGKGEAVNSSEGIRRADVESGRIDMLLVDGNLRSTRDWEEQREFFEHFERQPQQWGFEKLRDYPSGRFSVYYRPRRA